MSFKSSVSSFSSSPTVRLDTFTTPTTTPEESTMVSASSTLANANIAVVTRSFAISLARITSTSFGDPGVSSVPWFISTAKYVRSNSLSFSFTSGMDNALAIFARETFPVNPFGMESAMTKILGHFDGGNLSWTCSHKYFKPAAKDACAGASCVGTTTIPTHSCNVSCATEIQAHSETPACD